MTAEQRKLTRAAFVIARAFHTGGPRWTIGRKSGDGISGDLALASVGAATLFIVRNTASRMQAAAGGVGVWAADWLLFGATSIDVRADDVLSDGALAFTVTGQPTTDMGFLFAPCEVTVLPDLTTAPRTRLRQGLRIGLNIGF